MTEKADTNVLWFITRTQHGLQRTFSFTQLFLGSCDGSDSQTQKNLVTEGHWLLVLAPYITVEPKLNTQWTLLTSRNVSNHALSLFFKAKISYAFSSHAHNRTLILLFIKTSTEEFSAISSDLILCRQKTLLLQNNPICLQNETNSRTPVYSCLEGSLESPWGRKFPCW